MVGFNRRFAPMAARMKSFLKHIHEPLAMHYRVNAGYIDPENWVNDPEQGGGRVLGKSATFVDFLTSSRAPAASRSKLAMSCQPRQIFWGQLSSHDFANGSQGRLLTLPVATIFSKERVEIFGGGAVAVLEDFRRLELFGMDASRFSNPAGVRIRVIVASGRVCFSATRREQDQPIPFDEIVSATLATIRAVDSQASGKPVPVEVAGFATLQFASAPLRFMISKEEGPTAADADSGFQHVPC